MKKARTSLAGKRALVGQGRERAHTPCGDGDRSATKEVVIPGTSSRSASSGSGSSPTGRQDLPGGAAGRDLSLIEKDVAAQVAGGADVLDVNMGVPLTDEAELLAEAIPGSSSR